MTRLRRLLLAAAAAAAAGGADAHPDGGIDCSLALRFDAAGALARVALELALDAAHSKQVLGQLAAPEDIDGPRGAPLREHLAGQFGAHGWLLELREDDRDLALAVQGPPALRRLDDGRVALLVEMSVARAAAAPAATYTATCRDRSWYWFAGFERPERIRGDGRDCSAAIGKTTVAAAIDNTPRASEATLSCK